MKHEKVKYSEIKQRELSKNSVAFLVHTNQPDGKRVTVGSCLCKKTQAHFKMDSTC